jgi:hypothetical protein
MTKQVQYKGHGQAAGIITAAQSLITEAQSLITEAWKVISSVKILKCPAHPFSNLLFKTTQFPLQENKPKHQC